MNAAHQLVSRSVKPDKEAEAADRKAVQRKEKFMEFTFKNLQKKTSAYGWLLVCLIFRSKSSKKSNSMSASIKLTVFEEQMFISFVQITAKSNTTFFNTIII